MVKSYHFAAFATIPVLFFLLLFPRLMLADGKVFATVESPFDPSTTEQEAVIIHDGMDEHMVLRVNFDGEGENFAWIVPVPAKPLVTLERDYIFRVLKFESKPYIAKDFPNQDINAVAFPLFAALAYAGLLYIVRKKSGIWRVVLLSILGVIASFLFILFTVGPGAFDRHGPHPTGAAPGMDGVVVEETKHMGIYDTTTLSATDSSALIKWLSQNGFQTPGGSKEIFKHYIDKKWHFVAVKLSASGKDKMSGNGPPAQTPPLGLRFKSAEIVFPLKISSLSKTESLVNLYVLAPGFVQAKNFNLMAAIDAPAQNLGLSKPRPVNTGHLTRLWARLSPSQMEDVTLEINPKIKKFKAVFFTERYKSNSAMSFGLCALVLVFVWAVKNHLAWRILFTIIVCLGASENGNIKAHTTRAPAKFEYERQAWHPMDNRPSTHLDIIFDKQMDFKNNHGRFARTFEELGYKPSSPGYAFYLSREEYYPREDIDPYGFMFDKPGGAATKANTYITLGHHSIGNYYLSFFSRTLDELGDYSYSENGFTAVAIGNIDREEPVKIYLTNDRIDKERKY